MRPNADKCSVCSSKNHVDVHHINVDTSDNRRSNLVALCRSCHRYVHGWSEIPYSARGIRTRSGRLKSKRERWWEGRDTMNTMKSDKLLTPRQAGEQLGVTSRTIVRWINDGKIKAVKLGRVWRVPYKEVKRVANDGV